MSLARNAAAPCALLIELPLHAKMLESGCARSARVRRRKRTHGQHLKRARGGTRTPNDSALSGGALPLSYPSKVKAMNVLAVMSRCDVFLVAGDNPRSYDPPIPTSNLHPIHAPLPRS